MVDFKKLIKTKTPTKEIIPNKIYDTLDRSSDKGPLRPAQLHVLNEWFNNKKNEKDVLIKLNTGQGKTLIGLLILQSKLNELKEPVIYLCPDNYLVEQTSNQARAFGIKHCLVDNKELPLDFLQGESILITTVQKLFNGKTKFGLKNKSLEVNTILFDDSHSSVERIHEAFKIKIPNDTCHYIELKNLFEHYLQEQGQGSYTDIQNKNKDVFLPVPYWAWLDRQSEIVSILGKNQAQNKTLEFSWDLIKDNLSNCICVISGTSIEIEPVLAPLENFRTFSNARHRVYMSATITEDSFLIKGLGINKNSILNPITYDQEKWSGEKMVLIPSLIHDELDRDYVIQTFSYSRKDPLGIVAIAPSDNKAKNWEAHSAIVVNKNNIQDVIRNKEQLLETIVLSNRYDGIDFPDNDCRILIMDSEPYNNSLIENYYNLVRYKSNTQIIKKIRSVEQGVGRSVRGERDYSAIIFCGNDVIKTIRDPNTKKYFSPYLLKQIEIGLEISQLAKSESINKDEAHKNFIDLINKFLQRDEGWKEYYKESMNETILENKSNSLLNKLDLEFKAESYYLNGNVDKAQSTLQSLIDSLESDDIDGAWYLQEIARYLYLNEKSESLRIQKVAYIKNKMLLKPQLNIQFKKLGDLMPRERIVSLKEQFVKYGNYENLNNTVQQILDDLSFGVKADKFEKALNDLAVLLGFESERPDKEWKEGPDNFIKISSKKYISIECKNEVDKLRAEINEHETEQMNRSIAWCERYYKDDYITHVIIHPAKKLAKDAGLLNTHDVFVLRDNKLKILKKNVKGFISEFKNDDFFELEDKHINFLLETHHLSSEKFISNLIEKIRN